MDCRYHLFLYLQVVFAINSVVLGETNSHRRNKMTLRTKNERLNKQNEVEKGISKSGKRHHNCCQNGGRCILNNFCFCPKNFYGRFCQHEFKNRRCGRVSSGHFIRSDCDLCRCFDGHFFCMPRVYSGCEHEGLVDHSKKIDPLKGKNIEIMPDEIDEKALNLRTFDIDDDYAYYYNDIHTGSYATSVSIARSLFLLPIIIGWM